MGPVRVINRPNGIIMNLPKIETLMLLPKPKSLRKRQQKLRLLGLKQPIGIRGLKQFRFRGMPRGLRKKLRRKESLRSIGLLKGQAEFPRLIR
jgi:hypothetical protein